MSDRSQALNALIGAAVTIVLVFIPFSSVLGGAVAGYLQGDEVRDGLRVGTLSGVIAVIPMLLLFGLMGSMFAFGMMGYGGGHLLALGGVVGIVFLVSVVYVVGLSALGGLIGAAVKGDLDLDPQAAN